MWKTLKTNKYFNYFSGFFPKNSTNTTTNKDFNRDQIILNSNINKSFETNNLLACKSLPSLDYNKSITNHQQDECLTVTKRLKSRSLSKFKEFTDLIEPSLISHSPYKNKVLNSRRNSIQASMPNLDYLKIRNQDDDIKKEQISTENSSILNIFSSSLYVQFFKKVKNVFNYPNQISPTDVLPKEIMEEMRIKSLLEGVNEDNLTSNQIKNRVSVVQYAANNPIEDRYNAIQLKHMNGYCLQVLDGHGGPQVADFVNKKLHILFDRKYLEITKNNIKTNNVSMNENEKIIMCINYAFKEVVRKL